jgi:uncharacterized membrane protein
VKQTLFQLCLAFAASACFPTTAGAADISYADIEPILQQRCVVCHSGPAAVQGLSLDSIEGIKAGSDRGPVVIAGDPQGSELIRRLNGKSKPRMPMTGPPFLTGVEVASFEAWIAAGLPPGEPESVQRPATADISETESSTITFDRIAPIIATRCARCHTDGGLMGDPPEGYRLTSYESVMSRADRVRVLPGNPAASELLRRIRGQSQPRMPFDGPPFLSDQEIGLIEKWIAAGAPDSTGRAATVPVGARVRLQGRLGDGWLLDDLPLEITSRTRIDKEPGTGDSVRVRATVREDGTLNIERVRRR